MTGGPKRASRRGGAYLLVLACVMSTTVLCAGGLALSRAHQRAAADLANVEEARNLARAGVELGLHMIRTETDWRTARTSGAWVTGRALGRGTIDVRVQDPDGSFTDDLNDSVEVTGIGTVGRTRQIVRVTLDPLHQPIDSLGTAMASAGSITVGLLASATANQVITSNNAITAVTASVHAPVEAAGLATGLTFFQSAKSLQPTRTIPDAGEVIAAYSAIGTTISINSIPSNRIENIVLGPGINPYGAADPRGIYIIDCKTKDITLRNCRIVGTLVLANLDKEAIIDGPVSMQAYEPGMPALVASKDIKTKADGSALSEVSSGLNFNPFGLGVGLQMDADLVDTYPSRIQGLVYAGRNFENTGTLTVQGTVIVVGSVAISGSASIQYNSTVMAKPPPGFRAEPVMRIRPGSWRRGTE